MLGSVIRRPILELFLSLSDSSLLGLLIYKEYKRYFLVSLGKYLLLKKDFYFYYPDLGPGNIIVSDNRRVVGILD